MRILVVGINYAPDLIGVAKYNTELCEALVSFGHEVRVVTAPPYYPEWSIPPGLPRLVLSNRNDQRCFRYTFANLRSRKPTGARRLIHHASLRADEFMASRVDRASLAPRCRVFGRAVADVGGVFRLDRTSNWRIVHGFTCRILKSMRHSILDF